MSIDYLRVKINKDNERRAASGEATRRHSAGQVFIDTLGDRADDDGHELNGTL